MSKLLSVVLAILFAVTGAYAGNRPKSIDISATAAGSVQLNQTSYQVGNSAQINYSYAGLHVKTDNVLVLQTLCLGDWNGMVFDSSTEFFQSDKIAYSSSSGTAVDAVAIPDTYQGSGSCTVSLYLLYTVNNTRYSKTLATSTFNVAVQ